MELNQLAKTLIAFYREVRSDPAKIFSEDFQHFNKLIYQLALTGYGYNNYEDDYLTGEKFFIDEILSSFPSLICFDVGANIGKWSRQVLNSCNVDQMHLFEPVSSSFNKLTDEFSSFEQAKVRINHSALGDEEATTLIYYGEHLSQASFLKDASRINYIKQDSYEVVAVDTIDNYVKTAKISRIDVLKIDVEGYERCVLDGGRKFLTCNPPAFIQIEMNRHQIYTSTNLFALLSDFESLYTVYRLMPGGWVRIKLDDPESNIFHFSNYVLVRNDVDLPSCST